MCGNSKPAGMTPITVYGLPLAVIVCPTIPGIGAVATLPERMAQEHHLIAAALVLVRTKRAAEERLHVERVEELGGDHLSHDELRLAAARQREPGADVPAERVERARLTLEVEEVLGAEPRRR